MVSSGERDGSKGMADVSAEKEHCSIYVSSTAGDRGCELRLTPVSRSFLYWKSSTPEEKQYIGETRGYDKTLRKTTLATDTLTFQVC